MVVRHYVLAYVHVHSLICVFVIAIFTTYWFRSMGLQVGFKLRLTFEPLTTVCFKANITLYFQVDSTMRVILTLKCKSPSTGFAFIHDFIMTILVFCHSTRRTKELGAIRTWCQWMISFRIILSILSKPLLFLFGNFEIND